MPQRTRSTEIAEGAAEVLVFRLGGVRCALPLAAVVEVLRAVRVTPLPTAPAVVEGVIDVRGLVVPVLDLRARLGMAPVPVRADHVLILAGAGGRTVAVRADAVEWIASLDTSLVEPERIARGIGYLAGVARTADGMVLVHDLEAFLRQGEAEALEAALARHRPTARVGA
jgi:purine-binding chemotaxis protein CheW